MLPEKLKEVLKNEGVVSIVTWPAPLEPNAPELTASTSEQQLNATEPHVAATWNSNIHITNDGRLLIPAAGLRITEMNANDNNKVKLVCGSKAVEGLYGKGAGFLLEGRANFFETGKEFEMMKKKYPFLSRVLEVNVNTVTQTV